MSEPAAAMPTAPLMPVRNMPSSRNCSHDIPFGCAQRFAQANLPGSFGDRNQHDVHHPQGAQGQGHDTHSAQEQVHGVEDFAHHALRIDRVPLLESIRRIGIKPMLPGYDGVYLSDRG